MQQQQQEQRHITYHKVSQSHLPTLAGVEGKQRGGGWGGREERRGGLGAGGVDSRRGRFGGYQQNKRAAYAAVSQRGFLLPPPSPTLTPACMGLSTVLTLWSHRERSRAWRCRWRCWSSSSLSVVASSAPPGNAVEHWEHREFSGVTTTGDALREKTQSASRNLTKDTKEWMRLSLLLLCRGQIKDLSHRLKVRIPHFENYNFNTFCVLACVTLLRCHDVTLLQVIFDEMEVISFMSKGRS